MDRSTREIKGSREWLWVYTLDFRVDKSLFVIFYLKKLLNEAKREREERGRDGEIQRHSLSLLIMWFLLWVEAVIIFCHDIPKRSTHTHTREILMSDNRYKFGSRTWCNDINLVLSLMPLFSFIHFAIFQF